jgi:hypothetical protein
MLPYLCFSLNIDIFSSLVQDTAPSSSHIIHRNLDNSSKLIKFLYFQLYQSFLPLLHLSRNSFIDFPIIAIIR